MRTRVAVLTLALSASSLCGCAKKIDATFEGTITMTTTLAGKAPQPMRMEIKNGRMRFDTVGEGGAPMHGVYDPTRNEVMVFMDSQKAYMTLDFSRATAPASNTSAETSIAEKAGGKDEVAGISCEKWVSKEPSGKRSEVCVIEGVNFFDLTRLRAGAAGLGGVGPQSMQEKKMFPLRSVEYDASGAEISRMEVTAVDKKAVDESRFVTPADYKKLEIPPAPAQP